MKQKMIKSILCVSIAAMLSACGGGGGGSSVSGSQPTTQSTPNTNQTARPNTQNTTPSSNTTANSSDKNSPANQNAALFNGENKFKVKPPTAAQQQQIQIVIAETNKLRAAQSLPAVKYDAMLSAYAQRRAEEIVGRFDHDRPDGNQPYHSELKGNSAENLLAGLKDGTAAVEGWRKSPAHYKNIMGNGHTRIGVGIVQVPGSTSGYYWVQIFGDTTTTTDYAFDPSLVQSPLDKATANTASALTKKYQWLSIDGVPVYLGDPRTKNAWENFDKDGHSGNIYAHDDVRFGVLKANSGSLKVFYTGNNTQYENMPQTGSAKYIGKAVITDGTTANTNLDAQFQANFSDKKLTGTLSENGKRVVDINAHIRGTSFHSPQNAPVETQGGFFGKNANELGGVFHDKNSGKSGAYGAKR